MKPRLGLLGAMVYPCGRWCRYCRQDRLFFGLTFYAASGSWRERQL